MDLNSKLFSSNNIQRYIYIQRTLPTLLETQFGLHYKKREEEAVKRSIRKPATQTFPIKNPRTFFSAIPIQRTQAQVWTQIKRQRSCERTYYQLWCFIFATLLSPRLFHLMTLRSRWFHLNRRLLWHHFNPRLVKMPKWQNIRAKTITRYIS